MSHPPRESMVLSVTLEFISDGRSMSTFRKINVSVTCLMEEKAPKVSVNTPKSRRNDLCSDGGAGSIECSVSIVEGSLRTVNVSRLKVSLKHSCWHPT